MGRKIAPFLTIIAVCIFAAPFLANPALLKPTTTQTPQAPTPPIAPKMPIVPQGAEGGFWRVDSGFQSTLMIKNDLQIAPLTATPVLYMADGTEYDLAPIQMAPLGVAMVNINNALQIAPDSVRTHLSDYGSAGLRYQWSWSGVILGSIRVSDDVRSLVFLTHLVANVNKVHNPGSAQTQHLLEGTWWKQIPTVTGFLHMTNTSTSSISGSLDVLDSTGTHNVSQSFTAAPHTTRWIDLSSIWAQLPVANAEGAIEVSYIGPKEGLIVQGGLQEGVKGYSHEIRLFDISENRAKEAALSSSSPAQTTTTYDSAGIMIGAQDPNMQFPSGTRFTPYVVLRNTGVSPLSIHLATNYSNASGSQNVQLGSVTLRPNEARQLDLLTMMMQYGIKGLNGFLNLRTSFQGHPGDMLEETGSVDQSSTYVFDVPPVFEAPSGARNLTYWNTSGDTDTMVTFWNYTAQDEDILFTIFYQNGAYKLPVHLKAHNSVTMSLVTLIRGGVPDVDGNLLPANIVQGSARISGLHGNKDRINIAVQVGIFNVRTGTCSCPPWTCDGVDHAVAFPASPTTIVAGGASIDLGLNIVYEDGNSIPVNATWVSSDSNIANVHNNYELSGTAGGSVYASGTSVDQYSFNTETWYLPFNPTNESQCCGGDNENAAQDTGQITVKPTVTSITPAEGAVGDTVSVTITGTGFSAGSGPTVNMGSDITVTRDSYSNTSIAAHFAISSSATGGDRQLSVTVNSAQSANFDGFYVQIPTDFVPYTTSVTPNNGASDLVSGSSVTVVDLLGNILASGVCGGFQNFTYAVVDQRQPPQRITHGTVTGVESFSNFQPSSGPWGSHPTPAPPSTIPLDTKIFTDNQALYIASPPTCPAANGTMTFTQTFKIYLGSSVSGTAYTMAHTVQWTWTTNGNGFPSFSRTFQ